MKKQLLTKKWFKKCDMTSVNLEKTHEYLKIQESLRSENLTKYYRNIFICFTLPWKILYKHKVKQITDLARGVFLEERSMLVSMPAKSSFEHSEGSRREIRHLGTQKALGYLRTRRTPGHLSTLATLEGH